MSPVWSSHGRAVRVLPDACVDIVFDAGLIGPATGAAVVPDSPATFGSASASGSAPPAPLSIEFELQDVATVAAAEKELGEADSTSCTPRVPTWGQTVARVQAEDGTIVGISFAPWMHA